MIWEQLAPESSIKAKRSLIAVACCTLIFASFEFNENVLKFLGLELIISQVKVVRVGQIACLLLVPIFILRELPLYIRRLGDYSVTKLEKRQQRDHSDMQEDFFGPPSPGYEAEAQFRALESEQQWRKERLQNAYGNLVIVFTIVSTAILDFFFPIAIGLVAALDPYIVQEAISEPIFQLSPDTDSVKAICVTDKGCSS